MYAPFGYYKYTWPLLVLLGSRVDVALAPCEAHPSTGKCKAHTTRPTEAISSKGSYVHPSEHFPRIFSLLLRCDLDLKTGHSSVVLLTEQLQGSPSSLG